MASVREGVSLTLSPCDEGAALAAVASASLAAAEWHRLAPSVRVNLEIDVIARYVERMLSLGTPAGN